MEVSLTEVRLLEVCSFEARQIKVRFMEVSLADVCQTEVSLNEELPCLVLSHRVPSSLPLVAILRDLGFFGLNNDAASTKSP
jgi:hypothetical protein